MSVFQFCIYILNSLHSNSNAVSSYQGSKSLTLLLFVVAMMTPPACHLVPVDDDDDLVLFHFTTRQLIIY